MKVEYKKDLRHNYMIISEVDISKLEPYSIKVLEKKKIEGILPVEQRWMDNNHLFYYDITARQSMAAILDKTALKYENIKKLFNDIIETFERAYEYLLPEDDFILSPEYIYMGVASNTSALCFLPGYQKLIKEQMSGFIEYLMNKVDYNDKEAVLLVYSLYAGSREEGYTFEHLKDILSEKSNLNIPLKEKKPEKPEEVKNISDESKRNKISSQTKDLFNDIPVSNDGSMKKDAIRRKDSSILQSVLENNMPVMMEKLEGEEERPFYPIGTYLLTGAGIAGGAVIIILSIIYKIVYNSFGSRIDYSKLVALLLIIFCAEGYLMKLLWDKKNRITKIVPKSEYIDPRQIRDGFGPVGMRKRFLKGDNKREEKREEKREYKREGKGEEIREGKGNVNGDENGDVNRDDKGLSFIKADLAEKPFSFIKAGKSEKPLPSIKAGISAKSYPVSTEDYVVSKQKDRMEFNRDLYQDLNRDLSQELHQESNLSINRYVNLDYQGRNLPMDSSCEMYHTQLGRPYLRSNKSMDKEAEEVNQDMDDNMEPTCLLNAAYLNSNTDSERNTDNNKSNVNPSILMLKPLDERNYQTIPIKVIPFFIGKLKKNVDFCLENEAVSRYHAKITSEESQYYITDLNSTNGTFVNGEELQTYEKRVIYIGDEITFANIKYLFLQELS